MKYRSKFDIIGLLLEAANGGATKTKMIYQALVTYEQINEYLGFILEKDLVEYENLSRQFRTTEKGIRILKIQNQINDDFLPAILHNTRR
jgi:predicted transcriptional regulator